MGERERVPDGVLVHAAIAELKAQHRAEVARLKLECEQAEKRAEAAEGRAKKCDEREGAYLAGREARLREQLVQAVKRAEAAARESAEIAGILATPGLSNVDALKLLIETRLAERAASQAEVKALREIIPALAAGKPHPLLPSPGSTDALMAVARRAAENARHAAHLLVDYNRNAFQNEEHRTHFRDGVRLIDPDACAREAVEGE